MQFFNEIRLNKSKIQRQWGNSTGERMLNQFRLLVGAEAFVHEFAACIPHCQKNLYVQFSTFEGDASGQAFADLLIDRAKNGVDVRVLLDCYSEVILSDTYPFLLHKQFQVQQERARTHQLLETMKAHGIQIQRTAPPGFLGMYMLYRDHKKMIVMDDHTAFVGGINISDHNYAWHDFMVKIEGRLVHELTTDFCSTWLGRTTPFNSPVPNQDFILNQCAGRYPIFDEILAMINRSKECIVIESPYLLGDKMENALLEAALRGVKVKIIMPYHSNKWIYRFWVRTLRRHLAHPNITIYGYRDSHDMTHAKLVLVDNRWATFGSLNMFELEGATQKELNIFTSNTDFIHQLNHLIESDIQKSVVLPPPRYATGRFTYRLAVAFFHWWNKQLLKNPDWTALYC